MIWIFLMYLESSRAYCSLPFRASQLETNQATEMMDFSEKNTRPAVTLFGFVLCVVEVLVVADLGRLVVLPRFVRGDDGAVPPAVLSLVLSTKYSAGSTCTLPSSWRSKFYHWKAQCVVDILQTKLTKFLPEEQLETNRACRSSRSARHDGRELVVRRNDP